MVLELKSSALRKHINPKHFGIKSTEEVEKLKGIIGQQRAVRALKFGLSIKGQGYNIYVSGPPGIGKMTSIQSFLEEIASKEDAPPDWCYVNNFHDNYVPQAIELPPGKGKELKEDMRHLVQKVQQELPKIFESDEYSTHRNEILSGLKDKQEKLSREINRKARDAGFHLQSTPMGIMLIPIKDGKQLSDEDFQSMSREEKDKYRQKQQEIQSEMKSVMKKVRQLERSAQERTRELDRQITLNAVGGIIDDLKEKYKQFGDVISYLDEVQKDITDHADVFKKPSGDGQHGGGMFPYNIQQQMQGQMITKRYEVNLIIDNSKLKGAPVIMEFNPTYNNLIGRIEKQMQMGALNTDFTMIKSGSLLDANGGYIVISVEDLLKNIHSYDALKRTLKASKVQIEELTERLGFLTTKSLRPQPVPLKVKVLLVGPPLFFYMLYEYDHDFPELFKVKADFDIRMKMKDENITNFLGFLSTYSQKENLKYLSAEAAGRLMEHAARMVEDQDRMSTQFGVLGDVIRESHYWAEQNNNKLIKSEDIEKALEEKIFRSKLLQERIEEMIERGMILIDTSGEAVGQVNGLSVLQLGDYMFGKPSRITATVAPGRDGILDIEREVKLGGPVHSKGVMILSGYIARKYAADKPLSLSARLVFEQSYQGVEGDSASAAELYTILSAISEIPLKQGIAITGSMNQLGQIQAIGGVNQKIEGFFEVCRAKGLNGEQGVIIPASNKKNLMLREEVVSAVDEGKFHIWAIETVDEGLAILTGHEAGERQGGGSFSKDSVNEKIRQRLVSFAESMPMLQTNHPVKADKN